MLFIVVDLESCHRVCVVVSDDFLWLWHSQVVTTHNQLVYGCVCVSTKWFTLESSNGQTTWHGSFIPPLPQHVRPPLENKKKSVSFWCHSFSVCVLKCICYQCDVWSWLKLALVPNLPLAFKSLNRPLHYLSKSAPSHNRSAPKTTKYHVLSFPLELIVISLVFFF